MRTRGRFLPPAGLAALATRAADPGLALPVRRAVGIEGAPQTPAQPLTLPVDFHPPKYSTAFTPQDAGDIAAAGAAPGSLVLAGCTLQLPPGRAGVIRTLDLFATNTTRLTALQFMLRVDGTAPEGFNPARLLPVPGAVNARNFDTHIMLGEGARVELTVLNPEAGSGYYVGAAFTGWHWPREVPAGTALR